MKSAKQAQWMCSRYKEWIMSSEKSQKNGSSCSEDFQLGKHVTGHNGMSLDKDMDFFHPPLEDIGEVQTAHSTLRRSEKPRSRRMQMVVVSGWSLGGAVLGLLIDVIFSIENSFVFILFPVVGGVTGALVGWGLVAFSHTVTYVGEKGIAQISCTGQRESFHVDHMLLFDDAGTLRTRIYAHYTNNVYGRTDYSFKWKDRKGNLLVRIAGTHFSQENEPPAESSFHYASSAENSWTIYMLTVAEYKLQKLGYIPFEIRSGGFIGVGEGHLMIGISGKPQRIAGKGIKSIDIYGGTFQIRTKDSYEGWFRRKGIFEFDYSDLANAKLFLITLEKLLGFGLD